MATQVKSIGLTPSQTSQLQSIVNSSSSAAQSYSTGKAAPAGGGGSSSSPSVANPHDAPGYDPATDPTSSVYKKNGGLVPPTAAMPQPTPAPGAINTAQPNPQTAQVTPPNANPNLANAIAGKGSALTSEEMNNPQTLSDYSSRYKAGLQAAKATGLQAPATQGGAAGVIQNTLPNAQQESPSIIGEVQGLDSNFDSIFTEYDDFFKPDNQRVSLLDEYKKMSKDLGIEEMNAELVDAKRIIEGTEDDIRSEITSAGGMATDSQVLAMANARNKSLIKNYNYLLDSRNNAQTQLSTYMDLSVKDRQMAEAEFDRKLNFGFKVAEFKQKAVDNARSNYNAIVSAVGYSGLLSATNGNQYEQQLIEKTLGLGTGRLAKLATQPDLNKQLKEEQIKTEKAQQANIYSQINERSNTENINGTINGKPQNASQSSANSYANRLNEANVTLTSLGTNFTRTFSMLPTLNLLKSGDRQAYEQAQNNFVTAVLRRESGASIAPTEFETARKLYFPQPGDKPETVLLKEKARNTVINNFYREANVNRPVLPGMIVESNGKKYKVATDGETLEQL